jgi:cytochrome c
MSLFSFHRVAVAAVLALAAAAAQAQAQEPPAGDVQRGARAAQACMACHSFTPGQHMTGPSLDRIWGRKAGTVPGFGRYSDALRHSGIVWNRQELDAWLANPAARVPGNVMSFAGIPDSRVRADVIAYLAAVSRGTVTPPRRQLPDLKKGDTAARVTAIRACGDSYRVTTADGQTEVFWEFNLRLKTDSSASGPAPGQPVLVASGMQGDRASVVFSRFEEIAALVRRQCP